MDELVQSYYEDMKSAIEKVTLPSDKGAQAKIYNRYIKEKADRVDCLVEQAKKMNSVYDVHILSMEIRKEINTYGDVSVWQSNLEQACGRHKYTIRKALETIHYYEFEVRCVLEEFDLKRLALLEEHFMRLNKWK